MCKCPLNQHLQYDFSFKIQFFWFKKLFNFSAKIQTEVSTKIWWSNSPKNLQRIFPWKDHFASIHSIFSKVLEWSQMLKGCAIYSNNVPIANRNFLAWFISRFFKVAIVGRTVILTPRDRARSIFDHWKKIGFISPNFKIWLEDRVSAYDVIMAKVKVLEITQKLHNKWAEKGHSFSAPALWLDLFIMTVHSLSPILSGDCGHSTRTWSGPG